MFRRLLYTWFWFWLPFLSGALCAAEKDYLPPASALVTAAAQIDSKIALVIGVDYPGPDRLEWTADDAVEVGWLLKKVYGFEVICAITRPPESPERRRTARMLDARVGARFTNQAGILDLFDELVRKAGSAGAQVVVFFSGHGKEDPDTPEIGYLIPSDGDLNRPSNTLVDMDRFEYLSKRMKARHALFIVDSCYSGIAGAFASMDGSGRLNMGPDAVGRLMGQRARQVLTAGNTREKARMLAEKQMSAFSYFLQRALEPEGGYPRADRGGDGVVTVTELNAYLQDKMVNHRQTPRLFNFTENDGQFTFVPSGFVARQVAPPDPIPTPPTGDRPAEKSAIKELATQRPAAAEKGALYITARPPGVTARITTPSGKVLEGPTPVDLREQPVGRYHVVLSKSLHHPQTLPLDLPAGLVKRDVTLLPAFGFLTVTSDPTGADVYLDGPNGVQHIGKTPVERKKRSSGAYGIRVERKPRYHLWESDTVIADEQERRLHAQLKPAFGTLVIETRPPAAQIWIDGEHAGDAEPGKDGESGRFAREMLSRQYLVTVKTADGLYEPLVDRRVQVRDGQQTTEKITLRPKYGTLAVESTPTGQAVLVDEKPAGTTPCELKLLPGKYRLQVGADRSLHVPRAYRLTMVREGNQKIQAELPRKTGALTVYTKPVDAGAEVFLNEEKTARGRAPLTIQALPTGHYRVRVRTSGKVGRQVGSREVTVVWNKTEVVTVLLKPEVRRVKLRSEPVTVKSWEEARRVFSLNGDNRPLNYIDNLFEDHGDGTVSDHATGLMWQQGGSAGWLTYAEAQAYVRQLNRERFAGHGDWRLPTIDELCSLLTPAKQGKRYNDPVLDDNQRCRWSADQRSSGSAWCVHFYDGHVYWDDHGLDCYVRAVRTRQ